MFFLSLLFHMYLPLTSSLSRLESQNKVLASENWKSLKNRPSNVMMINSRPSCLSGKGHLEYLSVLLLVDLLRDSSRRCSR